MGKFILGNIPLAQVDSVHPPNQELMSDWLYCHDHGNNGHSYHDGQGNNGHSHRGGHGNNGHSHHDGQGDVNQIPSVIKTREQLISYLIEKGSEVILEDENDSNHNLIVNVISPSLITYDCDLISESVNELISFNPISSMLIEYKLLMNQNEEEKNELKQLRSSFTTGWTKISNHLMITFANELINASKSYLPKSSLISENKLFRALIGHRR